MWARKIFFSSSSDLNHCPAHARSNFPFRTRALSQLLHYLFGKDAGASIKLFERREGGREPSDIKEGGGNSHSHCTLSSTSSSGFLAQTEEKGGRGGYHAHHSLPPPPYQKQQRRRRKGDSSGHQREKGERKGRKRRKRAAGDTLSLLPPQCHAQKRRRRRRGDPKSSRRQCTEKIFKRRQKVKSHSFIFFVKILLPIYRFSSSNPGSKICSLSRILYRIGYGKRA